MGTKFLLPSLFFSTLLALLPCLAVVPLPAQTSAAEEIAERAALHESPEWALIKPHLPDPETADAPSLELAADVLRARRFNEDAIAYYKLAIDHGGDVPRLMMRIGITELQLRQPDLARAYFQRALSLRPKDGQIWNDLGATEFLAGNTRSALADYLKAVKLDKRNAIFHSNLATAYFEAKDYESARKHFELAFKLDPQIYERQDGIGIQARVFSSTDHGRFCLELARVAAHQHDDALVLTWLGKAADTGFDIRSAMGDDQIFQPYRKDPRVLIILQNQRALHNGGIVAANTPVTPLPAKPTNPW
jgi:tetratricopeptide (TPR) repeat protein